MCTVRNSPSVSAVVAVTTTDWILCKLDSMRISTGTAIIDTIKEWFSMVRHVWLQSTGIVLVWAVCLASS